MVARLLAHRPWAPDRAAPTEGAPPAAGAGRRHDLDGLRGLSVLLVVGFHFHVPGFERGATGVAVFFALSGYLIGGGLLAEFDRTGGIAVGRFLGRRVRRLLPAAALAVAAGVALGAPVGAALAAFASLANVTGLAGAETGALTHFWSLAIEEQFYAIAPIGLALVARRRRRAVVPVVLALALASALFAWWHRGTATAYFHTGARLGELLVGVALAAAGLRLHRGARPLGLAVLVVCLTPLGPSSTIVVAVAAVAVIGAAPRAAGSPGLLDARWLGAVGRRAYGLYLWHPIAQHAFGADEALSLRSVPAAVLTVVLVVASHHLVEQPFLRAAPGRATARRIAGLVVVCLGTCVVLG